MTDSYHTTQSPVRLLYVDLKEPRAVQQGKPPRYSVMLLIRKDSPELTAIKKAILFAMEEDFGKIVDLEGRCNPIKDCVVVDKIREAKGKTLMFEKLENPGDYVFINASSQNRPSILDRDLNEMIDLKPLQSGCYVRVNINAWTWENSGERGVSIGLNHVQFWAEGESLASKTRPGDVKQGKALFALGGKVDNNTGDDKVDTVFG